MLSQKTLFNCLSVTQNNDPAAFLSKNKNENELMRLDEEKLWIKSISSSEPTFLTTWPLFLYLDGCNTKLFTFIYQWRLSSRSRYRFSQPLAYDFFNCFMRVKESGIVMLNIETKVATANNVPLASKNPNSSRKKSVSVNKISPETPCLWKNTPGTHNYTLSNNIACRKRFVVT